MDTVDTVDYQTPPGQEHKERKTADVHVVHLTRKSPGSASGGGVLADAAAAVANAAQSAKDATFGGGKDNKTRE